MYCDAAKLYQPHPSHIGKHPDSGGFGKYVVEDIRERRVDILARVVNAMAQNGYRMYLLLGV